MLNTPTRISANGLVAYYPANTIGRDFGCGDVHACYTLLEVALCRANFDPRVDRLFLSGDLVDRGRENEAVLDWLNKPWVHAVRGNHDQWCIAAAMMGVPHPGHEEHGGKWFYRLPSAQRQRIAEALGALPIAIEIAGPGAQRFGVVHAGCTTPSWSEFTATLAGERGAQQMRKHALGAMWSFERINNSDRTVIADIDRIFVGHATVSEPMQLGNTIYIDTGCGFPHGALTIVDMNTLDSWTTRSPVLEYEL